MKKLSVIIPTHNRMAKLQKALRGFRHQSLAPEHYEIIVVDDASTDGTENLMERQFLDGITYIRQEKLGPAAARNSGIAASVGEYLLFTNDDTYPEPDLLSKHLAAHEKYGGKCGVLGYARWADEVEVTPFMHYITEVGGGQFSYFRITDPENVPWQYFYTCNISLARDWLESEPFATDMRYPILEDVELGYRLKQKGFNLKFLKDAVVFHDHQIDYAGFLQRQYKGGQIAVWLADKYPSLAGIMGVERGLSVELNKDILQFTDELRIIIEQKLKNTPKDTYFGIEKVRSMLYQCYSTLVGASYYQGVKDYRKNDDK